MQLLEIIGAVRGVKRLTTSRKDVSSISDSITGIFHNPGVTVITNVINAKHFRENWLIVAAADLCLGRVTCDPR